MRPRRPGYATLASTITRPADSMGTSRYAASRQKACHACVSAKAKCDRQATCCSRCATRGLSCVYPRTAGNLVNVGCSDAIGDVDGPELAEQAPVPTRTLPLPGLADGILPSRTAGYLADNALDVADGELVCPINADDISIRWMNAYVPTPELAVKAYQPSTIAFLYRTLKSYAGMAVRGRGIPPFIHPAQMGSGNSMETATATATAVTGMMASAPSAAIITCLSLTRICDPTLAGGSRTTADAAAAVLRREMDRLYAALQTQNGHDAHINHLTSLAVFQAYLLYALVLFFQLEHQADPFLRQAIVALQEIACTSARHGLVCVAERPRWPAWVVAEAKRRTLYTMYLFDSVLSAHDGQPSYLGVELRGLPAPGSKALWQASSLAGWSRAYGVHVDDWAEAEPVAGLPPVGSGLCIDELWTFPVMTDVVGLARRRRRVDQWLESVDEYGTMLYAVTSSTHGG